MARKPPNPNWIWANRYLYAWRYVSRSPPRDMVVAVGRKAASYKG